jgi:hypothetical protein
MDPRRIPQWIMRGESCVLELEGKRPPSSIACIVSIPSLIFMLWCVLELVVGRFGLTWWLTHCSFLWARVSFQVVVVQLTVMHWRTDMQIDVWNAQLLNRRTTRNYLSQRTLRRILGLQGLWSYWGVYGAVGGKLHVSAVSWLILDLPLRKALIVAERVLKSTV